jgi:tetratricopeptide (TPR) repeat protein
MGKRLQSKLEPSRKRPSSVPPNPDALALSGRGSEQAVFRRWFPSAKALAIYGPPLSGKSTFVRALLPGPKVLWLNCDSLGAEALKLKCATLLRAATKKRAAPARVKPSVAAIVFDQADGELDALAVWLMDYLACEGALPVVIISREGLSVPRIRKLRVGPLATIEASLELFHASLLQLEAMDLHYSARRTQPEDYRQAVALAEGYPMSILAVARQVLTSAPHAVVEWMRNAHDLELRLWHQEQTARSVLDRVWSGLSGEAQNFLQSFSVFPGPFPASLAAALGDVNVALQLQTAQLLESAPNHLLIARPLRLYARQTLERDSARVGTVAKVLEFLRAELGAPILTLAYGDVGGVGAEDLWALGVGARALGNETLGAQLLLFACKTLLHGSHLPTLESRLTQEMQRFQASQPLLHLCRGTARLFVGDGAGAEADFREAALSVDRIIRIQGLSRLAVVLGLGGKVKDAERFIQKAERATGFADPPELKGLVAKDWANVLVDTRDPSAAVYLDRARSYFIAAESHRERAFVDLLDATRACDAGQHELACVSAAAATSVFVQVGDERSAARAQVVLAVSMLDVGKYAQAQAALQRSSATYRTLGDVRSLGQVALYCSQIALEQGDEQAALLHASQALTGLRDAGSPAEQAHAYAWAAAAYACVGDSKTARDLLRNAESITRNMAGTPVQNAVAWIAWSLLDPLPEQSAAPSQSLDTEEVRSAKRVATTVVSKRARRAPVEDLVLSRSTDGTRIAIGSHALDLSQFPVLRLLLGALFNARLETRHQFVQSDTLIREIWQNESIVRSAAKNRLYVAVRRLRSLGLEDVIEGSDMGYRIAPAVQCRTMANGDS